MRPGHAEDLPGADPERQVRQPPASQVLDHNALARRRRAFRASRYHRSQRRAGTRFLRPGALGRSRRCPDDEIDQRVLVDLARGHLGNDPAVSEHDDTVGDRADRDQVV
jgi:uncharacterized protein involved in type VI secretion and phage assembly